jgi:hypothetical protein
VGRSTGLRRAIPPADGWKYQLLAFKVGAPTGEGLVQYVGLSRVIKDGDYEPDVASFQLQLQRVLLQL